MFWPASLACERGGMTSDRRVCKQLCDTLLRQRMEEQADRKDLLKQHLQDFV